MTVLLVVLGIVGGGLGVALLVREPWQRASERGEALATTLAQRDAALAQLAEVKRRANACHESSEALGSLVDEVHDAFEGSGGDVRNAVARLRGVAEETRRTAHEAVTAGEVPAEGETPGVAVWTADQLQRGLRLLGRSD